MPEIVINARKAAIGPGLMVNRILPFRMRRMVGPFIFMDHAGPVRLSTEKGPAMDVLPHPHIGLSTVSYLFKGNVTHRDSLGDKQVSRARGSQFGNGQPEGDRSLVTFQDRRFWPVGNSK